jgi:hypothetical protein
MSFMNRPGRSIHFIDRSIAPEMPRPVLMGIESLLDGDFAMGRARRDA